MNRPFHTRVPSNLSLAPRTARELAFRVLEQHRISGDWVQEELAISFSQSHWSRADRGFVNELVCGIVRRHSTLITIVQEAVARPWERIEPDLATILLLGAYQLVFLDRVPRFAAIHETVEIARSIGQHRWTGFINGVLRGIDRLVLNEVADTAGPDRVPIGPDRYRKLATPLFPAPSFNLPGYVAAAYSLPEWLVRRWSTRYSPEELVAIATACNTAPALYVRVNRRRKSPMELQALLQQQDVTATIVEGLDALRLEDPGAIELLPGYREGWFSPQDLTAMKAAPLLAPDLDDRIWDVCAAPGTKTCHLAELRDDHGTILATDIRPNRLDLIQEGATRLGLTSIQTALISPESNRLPEGPYEAILVDAPCSNTGVLHRRPEARWRIQPRDIVELSEIQRRLLSEALRRLAPGGRLLYSTCSIEPEENRELVQAVLSSLQGFALREVHEYLPGLEGDGGFQALIVRETRASL